MFIKSVVVSEKRCKSIDFMFFHDLTISANPEAFAEPEADPEPFARRRYSDCDCCDCDDCSRCRRRRYEYDW